MKRYSYSYSKSYSRQANELAPGQLDWPEHKFDRLVASPSDGPLSAPCQLVWQRAKVCSRASVTSYCFGLNYDPSHLLWMQMDYFKPLKEFAHKIFHVHLKDAKIFHDRLDDVGILATPLEFHTPKLVGLGDINWSTFFSTLYDVGYPNVTS